MQMFCIKPTANFFHNKNYFTETYDSNYYVGPRRFLFLSSSPLRIRWWVRQAGGSIVEKYRYITENNVLSKVIRYLPTKNIC